jgi:hypothetical protein
MGLEIFQKSGNQTLSNRTTGDKRSNPRYDIQANIQYLMLNMDLPEEGTLHNFSQTGALVAIRRKVSLGTRILFKVKSGAPDQAPIGVMATIVRAVSGPGTELRYGCQIDQITGLN